MPYDDQSRSKLCGPAISDRRRWTAAGLVPRRWTIGRPVRVRRVHSPLAAAAALQPLSTFGPGTSPPFEYGRSVGLATTCTGECYNCNGCCGGDNGSSCNRNVCCSNYYDSNYAVLCRQPHRRARHLARGSPGYARRQGDKLRRPRRNRNSPRVTRVRGPTRRSMPRTVVTCSVLGSRGYRVRATPRRRTSMMAAACYAAVSEGDLVRATPCEPRRG